MCILNLFIHEAHFLPGWAFSVTVTQQAAGTIDQSQARVESGATFRYTQLDLESIASLAAPCWRTHPLPKNVYGVQARQVCLGRVMNHNDAGVWISGRA